MNTLAHVIERAELDTYIKDAHAFDEGRYSILKALASLPGDHVDGGKPRVMARIHASSPTTIYDSSFDGGRNGRLRAATLITILRLGLRTTESFDDILAPVNSESVLKTYGHDAYAYMCCILHPRSVVSPAPISISEMDAKKYWDAHPETRKTALMRFQAAANLMISTPDPDHPFLFTPFNTERTSTK